MEIQQKLNIFSELLGSASKKPCWINGLISGEVCICEPEGLRDIVEEFGELISNQELKVKF